MTTKKEAKTLVLTECRETEDEKGGLCWRCEWRAQFHERNNQPRYECGDVKSSKYSCYMYRPVQPLVLASNEGDDRPLGGPAFIASRAHRVKLGDVELYGRKVEGGLLQYWAPKEAPHGKAKTGRAGRGGASDEKRRRAGRRLD